MNSAKPEKSSRRPSAWVASRVGRGASQGFTLIELMIVIAIILILATIAVGRYQVSYEKAKEATLKQDLVVLNKAIQDYTTDKEAAPNSLDDLVTEHYIGKIPNDPITGKPDWTPDMDCGNLVLSPDQGAGGICGVHSSSDRVSPFEQTPYSSW